VPEQSGLDVIRSQGLAQQWVGAEVDLTNGEVIRSAPVPIHEVELGIHDRDARAIIVYAINAGSSSLKLAAFNCESDGEELLTEDEQGLNGEGISRLKALPAPDAIGHRVVHGGASRWEPTLIDGVVLADIDAASVFAPRHQPAALAGIELAARTWPGVPQVACFDTGFHHELPLIAQTLPVPGVRRFGFHGLSYEWAVSSLGSRLGARAVMAHLGSGCSLAAVLNGRAHDTTMGLTPIGGLMMSSRSGDVDPGALVHLMRARGLDADGLERLVEDESGLLGVSGSSRDMRELLAARAADAGAALAVDLWVMTVRKHIGAMTAALGGIDTLVFTGGIGQRSEVLRDEICAGLDYLRPFDVEVVVSDENRVVARHTAAVVSSSG
jgi:acetate kinase